MPTLFVRKSGWHQLLTCIAIVASFLSGCAKYVPPSPPPTTSKELRSQLGKIGISDGSAQFEIAVTKPVTGAGEGAATGAFRGLAMGLETSATPIVILTPVFMVIESVKGVRMAYPEAKFKEFDKTFRATIQELNVPEILRQSVADSIRISKVSEITEPSDQAALITLGVVVKKIELHQSENRFGPHGLFITESARLIRAADGTELYSYSFRNSSEEYPFEVWVTMDAVKLRQEVEGICHKLAEQIVDDIFYTVRLEEERIIVDPNI